MSLHLKTKEEEMEEDKNAHCTSGLHTPTLARRHMKIVCELQKLVRQRREKHDMSSSVSLCSAKNL